MRMPKLSFMSPGWIDRAANTFFQTLVATVAVVSPQSWPEWSSVLITSLIAAGMSVARSGSSLPGPGSIQLPPVQWPLPFDAPTVQRPLENLAKPVLDEGQRWVNEMFGGKR